MSAKKKAYTLHQRALDAEGQCLFLIAEIDELRAALAQKEAAAPDFGSHEKGTDGMEGLVPYSMVHGSIVTHWYLRREVDALLKSKAAASGDLHAAIMALPMPYHPGTPFGATWDHFEIEAILNYANSISELARAALAQPVAVDTPIGAVLAYDTNGHSKACGQTIGANGAGQFVVVFHGTIEQSAAAAHEHIRSLERAGYRFNVCLLVNAEEGYHGPVITHVNAAIDAQDGEAT